MIDFKKKINAMVAVLLMTTTGYTYGDYDYLSPSEEQENCFSCQPVCCHSCGTGFISAGLIYWRPFEGGLDSCAYSHSSDNIVDGKAISILDGDSRDPDFKWNPGFRIGAGYEFAGNKLDMAVFWTHFNSDQHGSKGRGGLKINFDVVDFLGAYNIDLGSCFVLRPFAGVRSARINQKLHQGMFFDPLSFSTTDDIFVINRKKENFCGVGPLIGLEGDWHIGCGFSVYAEGSISWLYGRFDTKLFEKSESFDTLDINIARRHIDGIIAAADAEIGIRWMTYFCDNMNLMLQIGLEHHRYFDYNRIGNYGDLSFDGFNISAGIGF